MAKVPCPSCKQYYDEIPHFAPSRSKWAFHKRSEVCVYCLEKNLDSEDFNDVDSILRHLNLPFMLDDWMKLYEANGARTLRVYVQMFADTGEYADNVIDWTYYNDQWLRAMKEGTMDQQITVFQDTWLHDMKLKWQGDYLPEEFQYLENLYDNLLKSQNILPGISQSLAIMLCKLLLKAETDLREGKSIKETLTEIKNVMALAGFEAKGSKNTGDFETMGELVVWLEKKGWQPQFYDGQSRDEVDIVMKDTQAFLRRLVLGEPSLPDQVQQRKEAFIASKQLESEVFMDETHFDEYETAMLKGTDYEGEMNLEDDDDDDDTE